MTNIYQPWRVANLSPNVALTVRLVHGYNQVNIPFPMTSSMDSNKYPGLLFAYGSLIWRPDFSYTKRHRAWVPGYERRFWQASHDHRGTPSQPGRVVTMVPVEGGCCEGMVYHLAERGRADILAMLDEREQDGYERIFLPVQSSECDAPMQALTWIASAGNPSWAGEQPLKELAELIAQRRGPSGSNREYLLRLHAAFEQLGIQDCHVAALARQVEKY